VSSVTACSTPSASIQFRKSEAAHKVEGASLERDLSDVADAQLNLHPGHIRVSPRYREHVRRDVKPVRYEASSL
jgi:hypothetical protein